MFAVKSYGMCHLCLMSDGQWIFCQWQGEDGRRPFSWCCCSTSPASPLSLPVLPPLYHAKTLWRDSNICWRKYLSNWNTETYHSGNFFWKCLFFCFLFLLKGSSDFWVLKMWVFSLIYQNLLKVTVVSFDRVNDFCISWISHTNTKAFKVHTLSFFRCRRGQFWLIAIVYGISTGTLSCWSSVLDVILKPHGIGEVSMT